MGLLAAAVKMPGLTEVLDTAWPGTPGILVALVMSLLPLLAGQIYIGITNLTREQEQ
ncbi:MAG: hypothetical protein U9R79_20110 [Armatimonadota bacterium]|nr:hypothetical protein [Armatimonadota bacterium]